jgi:hypothetical protein
VAGVQSAWYIPWLAIISNFVGESRKNLILEFALLIMSKISQREVIPGVSTCCAHHEKNLKSRGPGGLGKALATLPGWKGQERNTRDRHRFR